MELFVGFLRQLRKMTDEHAGKFSSPGLTRFFAMLADELDEDYFRVVEEHLKALKFRGRDPDQRAARRRKQGQAVQAPTRP